jgi:hypothetical protein
MLRAWMPDCALLSVSPNPAGTFRKFSEFFRLSALVFMSAAVSPALHAQAPLASAKLDGPTQFVEASNTSVINTPANKDDRHRFWDKQNCALFVTSAALNGADFAVKCANLQGGGHELNPAGMFGPLFCGPRGEFHRRECGLGQSRLFLSAITLSQDRPS